jgi:hypothetical protein
MLKPTRTVLALAAGSLVLALAGAGAAAADDWEKNHYTKGTVVSHGPLKVRSAPTTKSKIVGRLSPHKKVAIECKKRGEKVYGNSIWYLLADEKSHEHGKDPKDSNDGWDEGKDPKDNKDPKDSWDEGKDPKDDNESWDEGKDPKDSNDGWDEGKDPKDSNESWDDGKEWQSGGDDKRAMPRAAYHHKLWVSARYVKNNGSVKYCH